MKTIILLVSFLLLIGCASSGPQKDPEDNSDGEQTVRAVNITPLSSFKDEWFDRQEGAIDFSGSYTRLLIQSNLPGYGQSDNDSEIKKYTYEKWGNWFTRLMTRRTFSINYSVNVKVGSYQATVPLVTVEHQSGRSGENWSRSISHSLHDFPLFLVRKDGTHSVPKIRVSVKGSREYASSGAATALSVALGVANLAGPSAQSVVTTLSEQTTKARARAIDDAISQLFSSGISEEHWTDRDLREWRANGNGSISGVKVDFKMPEKEDDWNSTPRTIGTWTITFDYPRPSVFSDWRVCPSSDTSARCKDSRSEAVDAVLGDLGASQVLSYPLVSDYQELGTIRAYITQKDWYTSTMSRFSSDASDDEKRHAAESLCKRIQNEITNIGLNSLDASIVAWAVTTGLPMPREVPEWGDIADCKKPT